jgi:hypothetical protein
MRPELSKNLKEENQIILHVFLRGKGHESFVEYCIRNSLTCQRVPSRQQRDDLEAGTLTCYVTAEELESENKLAEKDGGGTRR